MSDSTTSDVAKTCVAIFREIAGLTDSARGHAMTDAQILSDPIESFEIDSLTTMEYVMTIEGKFDIMLDEKAVNRCRTIGDFAALASSAVRDV